MSPFCACASAAVRLVKLVPGPLLRSTTKVRCAASGAVAANAHAAPSTNSVASVAFMGCASADGSFVKHSVGVVANATGGGALQSVRHAFGQHGLAHQHQDGVV